MIEHLTTVTLTVWRPDTSVDAMGGRSRVFANVGTVRAMPSQPQLNEARRAEQDIAEALYTVYVPHLSAVLRGDELSGAFPTPVSPDKRLRVMSVAVNSRSTYLRLTCEAVQTQPEETP